MKYSFERWADGKTCERCSAEIHSGWVVDGNAYGPTCGKAILRKLGVIFPKGWGPGSFDPHAMAYAVELQRRESGQWAYDYEARKAHKMIVGAHGWKIAQIIAVGGGVSLNTDEAWECYQAAQEGI